MTMKILVIGAGGQLGREFARQYAGQHDLVLVDRAEMDITRSEQVADVFAQTRPQAVVHCAAYTNVDGAESDFDGAFKVNVIGTQNVASQCLQYGAKLAYISTDYVFDGCTERHYREFDEPHPLNVYGKTKLMGEQMVKEITGRHFIVRTAWLYGDGNNFVKTMLKLAKEKDKLQVVHDQTGSPTYTKDLAAALARLLESDAYGTYHGSCSGECSWYDFACKIFQLIGCRIAVEPVPTEAFPRPAARPRYSVLDNYMLSMTVGDPMRRWEEALEDYLEGSV